MQEYLFLLWVFLLNLRESSTSLGTVHFLRGKGGLVEFFEVSLESCMTPPVTKFFPMTPPLIKVFFPVTPPLPFPQTEKIVKLTSYT